MNHVPVPGTTYIPSHTTLVTGTWYTDTKSLNISRLRHQKVLEIQHCKNLDPGACVT